MISFLISVIILETLALISFLIIMLKNNRSYKRIREKAEVIVKGKLDVEDIVIAGKKNNTTVLASSFNSIKSNLLTFIEATKGNVITLSDSIGILSKSVDANQQGNEQIANSVSTVAVKAAEQLELVKTNLDIIESNSEQMREIDAAILKIKSLLDETVGISENGVDHLHGYEKDMDAISIDISKSLEILNQFNDEIEKIEEVGDFIISISEQLRLLAFNASIEAARAGQAGKGFSVVADEMNGMSIKTKEGMGTINQIVGKIIESSKQVNQSIKNCETTFNQSKEAFDNVNNSFQSINQQTFNIHDGIKEISNKFATISHNSDESKDKASNLYDASQLISESTHEIAAASEETAAEFTQISENVDALGGMLTGIQNLLKQFNTSIVPVDKERSKIVKIAFLSMLDNDFWYGVRRGVFYAQKELKGKNVIVEYTPFTDNGNELNEQVINRIKVCMEQNFDVIILPGFLGAANTYLNNAIASGIKVVVFNCDCGPDLKRMACFSPDAYEAGTLAARSMEKAIDKSGNIVIISGDLKIRVNQERTDSFKKRIAASKGMRIIEHIVVPDIPDEVYKKTLECLKSHPNVDAIYLTSGMVLAVAKAINDTGFVGKVRLVGFDHSQEIFDYIKKGIIAAAIGQDPFGQGHDPIIWMYNHVVTGEPLPNENMPCRLSVVNKDNVDNLIEV